MNNERRKQLEKVLSVIEQAKTILETCRDEEQECYDNLSEGLQASERGQKFEENASNLTSAFDSLEEVESYIGEALS